MGGELERLGGLAGRRRDFNRADDAGLPSGRIDQGIGCVRRQAGEQIEVGSQTRQQGADPFGVVITVRACGDRCQRDAQPLDAKALECRDSLLHPVIVTGAEEDGQAGQIAGLVRHSRHTANPRCASSLLA